MEGLKRVSTYAREHGITTQYVYKLIEKGKIDSTTIDGVKFVKTNEEDGKK